MKKFKKLSREEEFKLFEEYFKIRDEKKKIILRNKIVLMNMGLVSKQAVKIFRTYTSKNFGLEDLIQEGVIGLIKAIDRFDHERGFKFGTYAMCWIKQAIISYIYEKTGTIKLSPHIINIVNKVRRVIYELNTNDIGIISKNTNLSFSQIEKGLFYLNIGFPLSIYAPINSLEGIIFLDLFHSKTKDPVELVLENEQSNQIKYILSNLSEKEEKILRMRFGITT